jgi:hypothetical protein
MKLGVRKMPCSLARRKRSVPALFETTLPEILTPPACRGIFETPFITIR